MRAGADVPREAHGVGDAYAAPGVVVAWAILRAADEAASQVVVRIVADPGVYPAVAAIGSNPFSKSEQALLPRTQTKGSVEIRVPRVQYADLPRTEIRFYDATATDAPALVVFYLGVPDTTPEFATEANLNAYLTDRIARARAGGSTGK
jgi:hypothetical protein